MQRLIKIFQEERLLEKVSRQFKYALYVYVICRSLFWLYQYDLFFGKYAFGYSLYRYSGNFKDVAFVLLNCHNQNLGYYFLFAAMALASLCLFLPKIRPVADLVLWLLLINLHYKIYSALTGGDYLLNQLLFFQIFLGLPTGARNGKWTALCTILHNGAVTAIMAQVCFVYVMSGLAKIIDHNWQQGEALQIIAQVEQFKLIPTPYRSLPSSVLLYMLNYLVMCYQLLFPVLAFVKKTKKPFLLFGIAMHLYIMCFMGLFWFATIMLITYFFFWPFSSRKQ
jgi:hypothetical protein